MTERLHVFGIRHHGPGSAASLVRALDAVQPEVVLIEGPPEADELLPFVRRGLRPPVALLLHRKDEPKAASFYPFAEYSPEWVAADWALRNQRPVQFIDLPLAVRLHPDQQLDQQGPTDPIAQDPLGHLAQLDGDEDGETWWNALVEEGDGDPAVFAAINGAMAALREAVTHEDSPHAVREAQREATMRKHVRKALKDCEGGVAVVVGAWHAPVMHPKAATIKDDNAVLRGLKKAKVVATWVPWTDSRLARASGYGAGVQHPGWYRSLWRGRFEHRTVRESASTFCVRVARALRKEGHLAPPSSVIDAVRLTEALAAVRELPRPGLAELRDASVATLCHGQIEAWRIVEQALLVGDRVGTVPDTVPQMPLAADLARQQRSLKLKPTGLDQSLSLDLRSSAGGAKSVLLHRLRLLGVPWGRLGDAGRSRGTFRENWVLRWDPEHAVALAEALRWGTTIEDAATGKTAHDMDAATEPAALAEAIREALLARLDDAAAHGVRRLQELAATHADISELAQAIAPLVDVLRYGTARELPTAGLSELVEGLIDRTLLGLEYAVRDLEAEAAQALRDKLSTLDQALARHEGGSRVEDWLDALEQVASGASTAPLLAGFTTRRLADGGRWDEDRVSAALSASLSPGFPLTHAAGWLEGFLGDAALVLLHDPALFGLVDQWLCALSEDDLLEALPLFRRATSGFSDHQRSQLLGLSRGEAVRRTAQAVQETTPAWEAGEPLLRTMLGLEA